ncbi:SusD/RagB family nutrient-binding outer membrane lipoprotein [Christiangramia sabulilitoris]|uniref:SusD/RagB family nutrient-binding outer membrane lipoprotein n=1 Tax=Christiangramia sabulilitoris TaxID=2583991 RepID=A0A550I3Z8_9FLAO|nr:SusD/RagB family nutrient-binding outer membrane lipoprotein [Christiangramia sabulilitoris]TRO65695.1 SusD/RagB family nutrient-binding outer membrane lipoprotein [Christiangramia sabulilitoris]
MKNINKYIGLLFLGLTFVSCGEDITDINENPNAPEVVPTNTIFNSATKEFTDVSRSSFNNGRLVLNWMEYWGQNSYADEDRYLYRETSAEGLYTSTYEIATDLQQILILNTDPDTAEEISAVGANENQIAAARIMLAYMFHQLTNTFGDVPYYSYGSDDPDFQALNVSEVLSPVFASQEKIYADILKELRESADMINTSEPVFTSGDNIFDGDPLKWKKFANSLILRVATNIKNVDQSTYESAVAEALADGVMESNADNAVQAYESADPTASPWWRAFVVGGRTDFAVAAPFVNLLKGETGDYGPDARLFEMAAPYALSIEPIIADSYERSEDYDDYEGVPFAYQNANDLPFTVYSFPSSKVLRPDYGEVLMEYAEVAFLISEYNDWDQTSYENGVRASMEKWGVASDEIDSFVASLPAANEENVITQKYVALYMQAHQAYAEYRRTGFPDSDILLLPGESYTLPPVQAAETENDTYTFIAGVSGAEDLPARLRYPVVLQTLNGENRASAVSGLDNGDTIFSKLFWDVD